MYSQADAAPRAKRDELAGDSNLQVEVSANASALLAPAPPRRPAEGWADPLIGCPYVWGGRDPVRGLDCWGLVEHALGAHFGWVIPPFAAAATYDRALGAAPRAVRFATQQLLIERGVSEWRRCAPGAGATVLLEIRGRPVHVGVMLDADAFVHALSTNGGTYLESIRSPMWRDRIGGYYVPA